MIVDAFLALFEGTFPPAGEPNGSLRGETDE